MCSAGTHAERNPPWTIMEGGSEVYILLAGSGDTLHRVRAALTEAGIEVGRTGRYLGDAAEADWFVRIAKPGSDRAAACLADVLGSSPPGRPADLATDVLRREVAAAHAREARSRAEIDRLQRELATRRVAAGADLEALRHNLELERAARLHAELAAHSAAERLDQALEAPPPLTKPVPTRTTKVLEREIETALAALLPKARLLRDTLLVVAVEFGDRSGVYKALRELHEVERGIPSEWKTLKGLDGWIERHVSNGQDNTGRAYARLDQSDRTWQVLISHKGQQTRDIAWLARK